MILFEHGYRLYLRHLEGEVEYLKLQVVHERQRAERAIDTVLSLQDRPVMPMTVPTPQEIKMFEAPQGPSEFERIGMTEDE